jgi:hypothetical protein
VPAARKAGAQFVTRLDVDDAVLDGTWQLEQDWATRAKQSTRPDAAGPSLQRLAEAVLRVAGVLAIEDTDIAQPCITPAHFQAARAMGTRWVTSTLQVIESLGASTFQRDADAVAETVQRHPAGISLRDIYRAHRRLRKRDFDELLAALEAQGVVVKLAGVRPVTGGHTPVIYRPGRRVA